MAGRRTMVTAGVLGCVLSLPLATTAYASAPAPVARVHASASTVSAGGVLDPSWGQRGRVWPDGGNPDFQGRQLVHQGDRTLVAGTRSDASGASTVVLQRLLASGRVDRTFGVGGTVLAPLPPGAQLRQVVVTPTGRIVLLGELPSSDPTAGSTAVLGQLLPAGLVDPDFGRAGLLTLAPPAPGAVASSLLSQPDGSLVVGWTHNVSLPDTTTGRLFLTGLTATGDPQPGFGTGGTAVFAPQVPYLRASLVGVGDGRILAVGEAGDPGGGQRPLVARFDAHGTLDPGFADSGVLRFAVPHTDAVISGGSVLPDGALVVVGSGLTDADAYQTLVARITPTGSLDARFGTGGVHLNGASPLPVQYEQAVLSGGRLVLSELVGDGPLVGRLVALDPLTGHKLTDFGGAGSIRLGDGQTAPISLISDGTGLLILLDTWTDTGLVRDVVQRRL